MIIKLDGDSLGYVMEIKGSEYQSRPHCWYSDHSEPCQEILSNCLCSADEVHIIGVVRETEILLYKVYCRNYTCIIKKKIQKGLEGIVLKHLKGYYTKQIYR